MSDSENLNNLNRITGAIEGNVSENQPRPPRNVQDLLRYSTEAASGVQNPIAQPLNSESRQFLENVLSSLTVDVLAQLHENLKIIKEKLNSDNDACEEALDNIFQLVDGIDFANDFHKIGGFEIFPLCLKSESDGIRSGACNLLAELCQNNPYCQEKALVFLPELLCLADSDPSFQVRIKALYAASCLLRDFEPALKQFTANNGFSILLRAMQSDVEKLNVKSAFLLSSLCIQHPSIKDELITMGFIEQLLGLIGNLFHVNTLEHVLCAIAAFLDGHKEAQNICADPQYQLMAVLTTIKENFSGKDEARELLEYANTIEKLVFSNSEISIGEDR